jgi:hypothetical protein
LLLRTSFLQSDGRGTRQRGPPSELGMRRNHARIILGT